MIKYITLVVLLCISCNASSNITVFIEVDSSNVGEGQSVIV